MAINEAGGARAGPIPDLHYEAIPAEPERLPDLRNGLAHWCERVGMSSERLEALTLASYEALANAAAHAYSDGVVGVLELHATYLSEAGRVEVTVTDHGHWRFPPVERGDLGGRGLILVQNLADHAEVTTGASGTTVHIAMAMKSHAAAEPAH